MLAHRKVPVGCKMAAGCKMFLDCKMTADPLEVLVMARFPRLALSFSDDAARK